jgi:hypothetical protein
MRRWDVRAFDGILTDGAGRLALFWSKRAAFERAAFINASAAAWGVKARCYIVDRRTGERYKTEGEI